MTVAERDQLLEGSTPDPGAPRPRRYNLRRIATGVEFFEARLTRYVGDEPEFHAYPTTHVPARVLRTWCDEGRISRSEYRRFVGELG